MAKGHPDLPRVTKIMISRRHLLNQLMQIDADDEMRTRVLRLEMAFQRKIDTHIVSLPGSDSIFQKFNTSPGFSKKN